MGQILLAKEEIEAIEAKAWLNSFLKTKREIRLIKKRSIAKAQLKKVMTDAPWQIGIGIRFLSEEEYQALLKEAGAA